MDIVGRAVVTSAWNRAAPFSSLRLRVNDTVPFNFYFYVPRNDPLCPFNLTRFASASITAQLLDAAGSSLASQSSWSEIVPSVSSPSFSRVTSGTNVKGEYDRVTLSDTPFSGSYSIILNSGQLSGTYGGTSASIRIYPTLTSEQIVVDALSPMLGTPYTVSFVAPKIVDLHGTANGTASTVPRVTEVNVDDLAYGYGWSGSLALTGGGVPAAAGTDGVNLAVKLTPSGGAAQTVLQLPVDLAP